MSVGIAGPMPTVEVRVLAAPCKFARVLHTWVACFKRLKAQATPFLASSIESLLDIACAAARGSRARPGALHEWFRALSAALGAELARRAGLRRPAVGSDDVRASGRWRWCTSRCAAQPKLPRGLDDPLSPSTRMPQRQPASSRASSRSRLAGQRPSAGAGRDAEMLVVDGRAQHQDGSFKVRVECPRPPRALARSSHAVAGSDRQVSVIHATRSG